NAYSDEILHAARLSPLKLTRSLSDQEIERVYLAVRDTLTLWVGRLRERAGGRFPEKVTAFHDDMAVHGRYKLPCPVCGAPVQRIVYASNECNYCARCQTGGRLLADRSLSRLLKDDWPKSIDDLSAFGFGALAFQPCRAYPATSVCLTQSTDVDLLICVRRPRSTGCSATRRASACCGCC